MRACLHKRKHGTWVNTLHMTQTESAPVEVMKATSVPVDAEPAHGFYSRMYLIRIVESSLLELFARGELTGTVHTCIGQEACAVGVINALDKRRDVLFSNHRAHGHYLAWRDDVEGLMAEIMGRHTGICGGLGGSQHLHTRNFYTNGIQGGIVPNAAGAALAAKMLRSGAISVVFLGDGTMGQGVVYESLNVASRWSLPLLFVLEDNGYAQTTPKHLAHAGELTGRARAFNVDTRAVVADDVFAVNAAATEAAGQVREMQRPFFLALSTYRLSPHSKGDDFRSEAEIESYRARDPLTRLGLLLPDDVRRAVEEQTRLRVRRAIERARASPPAEAPAPARDA
jgi:TPP-dependent pyruvate/acetoin dehydrogenase alpha subunit